MANEITHDGVVLSLKNGVAHVKIVQQSACSGCHAKSMCQASEMMVKEMDCIVQGALEVGERVEVCVQQYLGWKAVFYAFVVPMVVMMVLLFAGQEYWAEPAWLSGVVAIAALVPYYVVLHQFEKRFEKQYRFVARKK